MPKSSPNFHNLDKKIEPNFKQKITIEKTTLTEVSQYVNFSKVNSLNNNFSFYTYGFHRRPSDSFLNLNIFDFGETSPTRTIFDVNLENNSIICENNFDLTNEILPNYIRLRTSSFINFFVTNMIDIPICFKKSKSLKNKNFEFFFLKFTNLIMRHGKREKTFRHIWNSFFFFYDKEFESVLFTQPWLEFFFTNNLLLNTKDLNWKEKLFFSETLIKNDEITEYACENPDWNFFIKNFLFSRLTQISPLFSYFIFNVDKNVRKFTRGKSGKYIFVWKYIAPYKRDYLMYRWFIKELKFDENRNFESRLSNLFNVLTYNIKQTYAWKAKNYTYAFIFKNFRKTFMTNLKTFTN